jgi:hypothetical protein
MFLASVKLGRFGLERTGSLSFRRTWLAGNALFPVKTADVPR